MTTKRVKNKSRNRLHRWAEKGNALVLLVIALPVMLAAAGLALDWGRGVHTKTQLQKAADSAALAGASKLPGYADAEALATEMVAMNFDDVDDFIFSAVGNEFKVELTENVNTLLMRILGYETMEVYVSATAVGERNVGSLREGGFPIAMINPNTNDDPTDDLEPFNYGRPYIIGYGETNVIVEDWANGSEPNPQAPQGNPSTGWRGALKLKADGTIGGAGAVDLRYNMINGWAGEMGIGDVLPVESGNMAGPMCDGREGRLALDPPLLDWDDFDPETDTNNTRVVLVPIVHLINDTRRDEYTMQDWNNDAAWDKNEVVVDGFAPFFLLTEEEYLPYIDVHGKPHDWVVGFFIPGVTTNSWGQAGGGGSYDFGMRVPPRLID